MQARALQARAGGGRPRGGARRRAARTAASPRRTRSRGSAAESASKAGAAAGDAGEDAAGHAGGERLRPARAVRRRDRRRAPSIPGAFVRPGHARWRRWSIARPCGSSARCRRATSRSSPPGTPVQDPRAGDRAASCAAKIARRSPAADLVHADRPLRDRRPRSRARRFPWARPPSCAIDVGEPVPATEIPLVAASVRGSKATVFVVEGQTRARRASSASRASAAAASSSTRAARRAPRRDRRARARSRTATASRPSSSRRRRRTPPRSRPGGKP